MLSKLQRSGKARYHRDGPPGPRFGSACAATTLEAGEVWARWHHRMSRSLLDRRVVVAAFTLLLLMAVSCGGSTDEPNTGDPNAVEAVEHGVAPATLKEAAGRSDAVVHGEVVEVRRGRILESPEDEPRTQVADVILDVSQVLSGNVDSDRIVIEMLGWEFAAAAQRDENEESLSPERELVTNGLSVPAIGAEMVWFVVREDGDVDGAARYGLISLDGFFFVRNDRLTSTLHGDDRLAARATGTSLEELTALLKDR